MKDKCPICNRIMGKRMHNAKDHFVKFLKLKAPSIDGTSVSENVSEEVVTEPVDEKQYWSIGYNNIILIKTKKGDKPVLMAFRIDNTKNVNMYKIFSSALDDKEIKKAKSMNSNIEFLTEIYQDLKLPQSKKSVDVIFSNIVKLSPILR